MIPENKVNDSACRRAFKRSPIECILEVTGEDIAGNKYKDTADLKNISGGGANFITQLFDKYFPGQPLELTFYLPGTDELEACLRGNAMIVWIDSPSDSGIGNNSGEMVVAVELDTPLKFEKFEIQTSGVTDNHK